jgi:hypothetical protein
MFEAEAGIRHDADSSVRSAPSTSTACSSIETQNTEIAVQRLSYSQRILWKGGLKYVFNGFDYDELYDLRGDPHELTNLIRDPAYRDTAIALAREMWNKARVSGDASFLDSEYFMYRFAPVGPEREKQPSVYNRGA